MTHTPINISFEFFPPRGDKSAANLWKAVGELTPLSPKFASVTYGAGGSEQDGTDDTLDAIKSRFGLDVAGHLTCVDQTKGAVNAIAESWWDKGIKRIVALRGDSRVEGGVYKPHPDGYENAADLVAGLKRIADFDIAVAAYPEVHPDSKSASADIDNLKRKLDAGANSAITQYFFNADDFLRFRDRADAAGITQPIVAGILPVVNIRSLKAFSARCGANVPDWLTHRFESLEPGSDIHNATSVATAAGLCHRLRREGTQNFHLYTLNSSALSIAVCKSLGINTPAKTNHLSEVA